MNTTHTSIPSTHSRTTKRRSAMGVGFVTSWTAFALVLTLASATLSRSSAPESTPKAKAVVDFDEQVNAVLERHCWKCHGAKKQQGGLRLDTVTSILDGGDNGPAVVAKNPSESLLLQAVTGTGDVSEMPPKGDRLSVAEIALLTEWVRQGAKAPAGTQDRVRVESSHWAFQPIASPELPAVKQRGWVRNPIDRFVLARLEQRDIAPAPEASRATLIRRLSLDLLGLPPTPEQIDAFDADPRPDAYERLVDRLLDSPHYGERWGRHWLDVARYADSNGYTIDGPRQIWKYRDWVIDAFNADLPFDRFVIDQLAGDLRSGAKLAHKIATGFHRNTMFNQEGGTDDEQFRVERTVDRVNTTGTAFLGLTIGCAQCHSHKFDPVSQRDYYQFYAFFNDADERSLDLPTTEQASRRTELEDRVAEAKNRLKAHDEQSVESQRKWEQALSETAANYLTIDPASYLSVGGADVTKLDDQSLRFGGANPKTDHYAIVANLEATDIVGFRLEVLTDESLPQSGPGRGENGAFMLTRFLVEAAPIGDPTQAKSVPLVAAVADRFQKEHPIAHAIDDKPTTGWALDADSMAKNNVSRTAQFKAKDPVGHAKGTTFKFTLEHEGLGQHNIGRLRLSAITAADPLRLLPTGIVEFAQIDPEKRSDAQKKALTEAFRKSDPERAKLEKVVAAAAAKLKSLRSTITTTMVLGSKPRETHIHVRGDFLRKGAPVSANVPAVFPGLPEVEAPNRLDLARWLVSDENPLTARVAVNRFWQRFFGLGLVTTENDFGTQGSAPTHPLLLDWLATRFRTDGWSVKRLLRSIVTSATYRQSSRHRPELAEIDQRNLLLARQNRVRLEAESIRDVGLAVSGRFTAKLGGPSVHPYQPEGIMQLAQVKREWKTSTAGDQYRRGMYTYFWRSTPHPFLKLFDAPEAQVTCTRRNRSNTPMQSLTLLNDASILDMARAMARRILRTGPSDRHERTAYAFRLCMGRRPSESEHERLDALIDQQIAEFTAAPKEAEALVADATPSDADVAETAAWTAFARVLLNLDEFITRE